MKSKPLVQSKRLRKTLADLEHMENDEMRIMGTGSTVNKRESDQPEESTVKEQRVDDVAMDQGPRDAGVTKMRMDEMLMDQVMAVSSGTSRVCENEEKARASDNPRIARRSCQERSSKRNEIP